MKGWVKLILMQGQRWRSNYILVPREGSAMRNCTQDQRVWIVIDGSESSRMVLKEKMARAIISSKVDGRCAIVVISIHVSTSTDESLCGC